MSDYYSDVDLLPCPFCGEQPSMWRDKNPDTYGLRMWHISCVNMECGVAPRVDLYRDDIVIEYWQKRAWPPTSPSLSANARGERDIPGFCAGIASALVCPPVINYEADLETEMRKEAIMQDHGEWYQRLDERQRKEVDLACVYAREYAHGTAGHNQYMLIAALVKMLDEAA